MEQYWIWFSLLKLPAWQKIRLLQEIPEPEEIYRRDWENEASDLPPQMRQVLNEKDMAKARHVLEECRKKDIEILTYDSHRYPPLLKSVEDAPVVLYCKGPVPDWQAAPLIGIVGTRKLSSYGEKTAIRMGRQIAACGAVVVSGGALGVDALAMDGALSQGGPVVGVLGCGVDIAYPKTNAVLLDKVTENGCLLSEYPPGTRPAPWQFPQRNRIISGICNALLVVEAPSSSGALITASLAREQSRDVYVVPGNVGAATCVGSNALLQEGAAAAMCGWDILRDFESLYPGVQKAPGSTDLWEENTPLYLTQEPKIPQPAESKKSEVHKKSIDKGEKSSYSVCVGKETLSQEEQQILSVLTREVQQTDQILAQLDMPSGKALSLLTKLTLTGLVKSHPGKGLSLK